MANIHPSYDIADNVKNRNMEDFGRMRHLRTFHNSMKLQAFDKIAVNPEYALQIVKAVDNVMTAYTEFEMM